MTLPYTTLRFKYINKWLYDYTADLIYIYRNINPLIIPVQCLTYPDLKIIDFNRNNDFFNEKKTNSSRIFIICWLNTQVL
jgi:hypothetical protein